MWKFGTRYRREVWTTYARPLRHPIWKCTADDAGKDWEQCRAFISQCERASCSCYSEEQCIPQLWKLHVRPKIAALRALFPQWKHADRKWQRMYFQMECWCIIPDKADTSSDVFSFQASAEELALANQRDLVCWHLRRYCLEWTIRNFVLTFYRFKIGI